MRTAIALILSLAAVTAGCAFDDEDEASLPTGSETVELDAADFTSEIDNPYWPMKPGTKWVYREGPQRVEITVTGETKQIEGIQARVVHDLVTENGEPVEDTFDWYAQDNDGNIWYLGEDTKEYEKGKVVSTEGSWEAGIDGAQAGIVVPGEPRVGMEYRQEYLKGEAEDAAEVLSLDERVAVPYRSFEKVLMTKDFTPLDPKILEHKFYARGVGPVLVLELSPGAGREELLTWTSG